MSIPVLLASWAQLDFADRLGLLVDREAAARDTRRLGTGLKTATLRYPATLEDLDLRAGCTAQRSSPLSTPDGLHGASDLSSYGLAATVD